MLVNKINQNKEQFIIKIDKIEKKMDSIDNSQFTKIKMMMKSNEALNQLIQINAFLYVTG